MVENKLSFALLNPATLAGDGWEFLTCWFTGRSWLVILASLFPITSLGLLVLVLFVMGASESKESKLGRYDEAAKKVSPAETPTTETESKEDSKQINSEAMLYFRRILQLEKENKRARYYVAIRQASLGSLIQARKMMETLAPSNAKGYEDAHVWLAIDLLRQKINNIAIDEKKLTHHLSVLSGWDRTPPRLLFAYAQRIAMAKEEGWEKESTELITRATNRDKTLLNEGAKFLKALGMSSMVEDLSERSVLFYARRLKDASPEKEAEAISDRANLAVAYWLKSDFDSAKKTLLEGINLPNTSTEGKAAFSRLVSELCMDQYVRSISEKDGKYSADWGKLNEAITFNPLNPAIGEQIAILMNKEMVVTDEFQNVVERQVLEGQASSVTYFVLGVIAFKNKEYQKSVNFLRIACEKNPDWMIAWNNYAMALTLLDAPDLQQAENVMKTIINRLKNYASPNDLAESLDTLGRIMLKKGELSEAGSILDEAIRLAPNRIDIREVMIEVCQKRGMNELAQIHQKAIEEMRSKQVVPNDTKK